MVFSGYKLSSGIARPYGSSMFSFYKFIYLFIYLFIFGRVGSSLLRGLSLVAVSRGYFSLGYAGFSLWWLLLLQRMGSVVVARGLSSCGTRA